MKSLRFRKKAEASSASTATQPNFLRRFAHKAKKIFHPSHPSSPDAVATLTTPPAQLQEAAAQPPSSVNEVAVPDPAEWLSSSNLPNQVVASQKITTTSQRSRLPKHIQRTLEGASSVHAQPADKDVDFLLPQPQTSKLSEPNCTSTTRIATAESSGVVSDTTNHQTEPEEDEKHQVHARFQQSVDVGNRSFFVAPPNAGYQRQQVSLLPATPLTNGAEDFSDSLVAIFGTAADEICPECADTSPPFPAQIDSKPISEGFFSAQSYREVEMLRRQRIVFAARLEAELETQKTSLEADFEKCYDTADRLHEIDLLNLKEDHEADVKSLEDERDVAFSEIEKLTGQREGLQNDLLVLGSQVSGLEKLLAERTKEMERHQRQTSSLTEDNQELVGENGHLRQVEQEFRARLLDANRFSEDLHLQNNDLVHLNANIRAVCEAERKEKESAQRQLVALVEQKSRDFAWHIQESKCTTELKSEDEEAAESKATAMARELHRRETEKVMKLSNELAELHSTTDRKLQREARTNVNLSEVAQATAMALDACVHEKQELEQKFRDLLVAVSEDVNLPELARGLSGDLQVAFEERSLFSRAFMEAELQLIKSEQKRRDQVCDLRDLVREKEDEAANVKKQLDEAELKISGQDFILEARDDEIKNTVPELKERIAELEKTMELQVMDAGQFQNNVITDLMRRHERQQQLTNFYEHQFMQSLNQFDNLKTEWDFYLGGTLDDLQLARGFRDQRDTLNIECLALRERFADELLLQPLVIPETLQTKSQIEEEQLRNMDEGVLKQFVMTYKALPKWLVEPGCPGYEQLRIDVMLPELERQQKERESIDLSFRAEGQEAEGGDSEQAPEADEEEDCTF